MDLPAQPQSFPPPPGPGSTYELDVTRPAVLALDEWDVRHRGWVLEAGLLYITRPRWREIIPRCHGSGLIINLVILTPGAFWGAHSGLQPPSAPPPPTDATGGLLVPTKILHPMLEKFLAPQDCENWDSCVSLWRLRKPRRASASRGLEKSP